MKEKINKLSLQQIQAEKPTVEAVGKLKRIPVVLVLDSLRSLYNIGSIFRTADALLIEKIYLCGICGTPPDNRIEKVALGATETVPFEYFASVGECLDKLRGGNYQIVALELTDQSVDYHSYSYKYPSALVVGNEVEGISLEAMERADAAVDIPMRGRANSLNVATAVAVVGYEMAHQYTLLKKGNL